MNHELTVERTGSVHGVRTIFTSDSTVMAPVHILCVTAELVIERALRAILAPPRYRVAHAADANGAVAAIQVAPPDLIVTTDIQAVVEMLRGRRFTNVRMPAIVAVATHPEDGCVRALRSGADDYVTYPFQTAELQARIDALMRRFQPSAADVIEAGDLRVDLGTREVTVAGRPIHLRPKEYDMFVYLLRRPRNVHSHRALLAALWGPAMQLRPHYVRMCVAHLRRQIEPQPESPCYIVTERAVGYRLQPSGGRHAA